MTYPPCILLAKKTKTCPWVAPCEFTGGTGNWALAAEPKMIKKKISGSVVFRVQFRGVVAPAETVDWIERESVAVSTAAKTRMSATLKKEYERASGGGIKGELD